MGEVHTTESFELGNGKDACLLLHGFTGSPWDMRPLGEALAQEGYFVSAPRLPGHGTTPEALSKVHRQDWEQAAQEALFKLSPYRRIFLCGLSMGALLSTLLAARYPSRVGALALLAPAMEFLDVGAKFARVLRRFPVLTRLKPWVPKTTTDIEDEWARRAAPLLPAFPTARLRDLWELQDSVQAALPYVTAKTLVIVAEKDHVVSLRGAKKLAKGLTQVQTLRLIRLERGFHILPRDKSKEVVCNEVIAHFRSAKVGNR